MSLYQQTIRAANRAEKAIARFEQLEAHWVEETDGTLCYWRAVPRIGSTPENGWADDQWYSGRVPSAKGGFCAARMRRVGRRWKFSLRPHPRYDGGVHTALSMGRNGAMLEAERAAVACEAALRMGQRFPEWDTDSPDVGG